MHVNVNDKQTVKQKTNKRGKMRCSKAVSAKTRAIRRGAPMKPLLCAPAPLTFWNLATGDAERVQSSWQLCFVREFDSSSASVARAVQRKMIQGYGPVMQAFLGTLFTWGLTAAGAALVIVIKGSQVRRQHNLKIGQTKTNGRVRIFRGSCWTRVWASRRESWPPPPTGACCRRPSKWRRSPSIMGRTGSTLLSPWGLGFCWGRCSFTAPTCSFPSWGCIRRTWC